MNSDLMGGAVGRPALDGRRPLGRLRRARRRARSSCGASRSMADVSSASRAIGTTCAAPTSWPCRAAAPGSPRRSATGRPALRTSSSATFPPAACAADDRVGLRQRQRPDGRRVERRQPRRAGRALARGRRTPDPGLVLSRRPASTKRSPAPVVRPDPRRAGHALRLVADVGVAGSSRRPASASTPATRAARRATARRS